MSYFHRCLLPGALGMVLAAATPASARPLELDCLDRFDFDHFTLGCWSMPPQGGAPQDAAYWTALRDDGFNAVLGAEPAPINRENDLEPVLGIVRQHPAPGDFPFDLLHKLGVQVMLCSIFERVPQIAARDDAMGRHPAVLGYHLCDNCFLHDITADAAWWLRRYAPAKVPWVSYNPQPVTQIRAGLPIITSQNYPFLYDNNGTNADNAIRQSFEACANYDRLVANRYHGAVWPVVSTDGSPSQYRFQYHASAAYGAQGIWLFGYHGYTRIALREVMRPTHRYLTQIAGPWLLGRRSAEVLHTAPEIPPLHTAPGPGKLIEAMDDYLLAGLLVPERDFDQGNLAADCVYIVDKRTQKFLPREELKAACRAPGAEDKPLPDAAQALLRRMYAEEAAPRAARVTFSAGVRRAWALLPDGSKRRYDLSQSRSIELPPLEPGGGILLRIEAAPAKVIRLPAGTAARAIPNPWKQAWDAEGSDQWHLPQFDDSQWKPMNVGFYGTWLTGAQARLGVGWYRTRYTLPEDLRRKHVYLHFGAADEQAQVYVDGAHLIDNSTGANKVSSRINRTLPFWAEYPALADGQPHVIAVKVINIHGVGGLYEPAAVVVSDEPLDGDQLWMATEPIRQARIRL